MEITETRMEILWRDKARRELKAVYDYLSKKNLYIITVWDCRQAPAKLRQSFH